MLFTATDLDSKAATANPVAALFALPGAPAITVLGRKVDALQALPKLTKSSHLHFVTKGHWSSHELLTSLLAVSGPANVSLTSWGLTEDPVRQLVALRSEGQIKELTMLIDRRIMVHCPTAYHLAKANIPRLRLINIHAKVIVVRSADWNITLITSANFTRNKRIEVGVISEDKTLAALHEGWIHEEFDGANI